MQIVSFATTMLLSLIFFQSCKSREPVSSSKSLRDTNFDVSYDEITKKYKVSCRMDRIHTYDNGDQTCNPTFASEPEILKACETDAAGKCGTGSMWTLDMCTEFRFARLESLTIEVMSDWGEVLTGKSKSEAFFDYCKTFAYGLNKILVDNPAIYAYLKSKFIRVQSKELKAKVEDKIVTIHWDIKSENLEAVFADAKASPGASSTGANVQFASDVVRKLSSSPLPPRSGHAVVSVGSKVVVWGGFDGSHRSDGAIFDVSTSQWVEMPKGPLTARTSHSSAAVGSKMVIWGGYDGSYKSDGAIFDVSTSQWVEMQKGPLKARDNHSSVAVGSKVVIWGGMGASENKSDGAIFDVLTNQRVEMPKGPLSARYRHSAAAVGSKVVIWGGYDGSYKSDGAIFDVSTSQWVEMPKGPLTVREDHSSAVVGSKVVIWGGNDGSYKSDGAIFDMSTNQWVEMPKGPLTARDNLSSAAVGSKVLIWGGYDGSYKSDGAIFDVATMTWMK